MDFFEKMKEIIDRGIDLSKDAWEKAGTTIQDFGDRSVSRIELFQLENKVKHDFTNLGMQVYTLFRKEERSQVDAEDTAVKNIITNIDFLRGEIEKRQESKEKNK